MIRQFTNSSRRYAARIWKVTAAPLLLAAVLSFSAPVQAAFVNSYAPDNFTLTNLGFSDGYAHSRGGRFAGNAERWKLRSG